jgi:hypothetical protein
MCDQQNQDRIVRLRDEVQALSDSILSRLLYHGGFVRDRATELQSLIQERKAISSELRWLTSADSARAKSATHR